MGEISEEMRKTEIESREWYMAAYAPESAPSSDHLQLCTIKILLAYDSIPDQHVVLETLFLSLDLYLRSKMTSREDSLCSPQYNLNEVVSTFGVGKVIRSKDSNFGEGDIVLSPSIPIAECSVLPSQALINKIDPKNGMLQASCTTLINQVIDNRGESCVISRLTKENKVADLEVAKTRRHRCPLDWF